MELGIRGRRAVVAGSSAGLGLAAARALAAEGVKVTICGRDPERLAAAERSLRGDGAEVLAVVADVSSPTGAAALVDQALEHFGGVDILVANAGGPPPGTFATTTIDAYRQALELSLLSTVSLCQATVPAMQAAGWGRVVAITSIGARQPIGRLMASSTARAGVTGFLKVLATEVAPDGVTVNSVQPGLHATDRLAHLDDAALAALRADVPAGVVGDPADLGSVIAFLCSEHARFVTGVGLAVDGGASRGLL